MKVIESLENIPLLDNKLVVALGNFDGVHIGHRHLLKEMIDFSLQTDTVPAVFLFHPHPQKVLDPANAPKLLLDLEKKIEIFESLNIEIAFIIPFNMEIASFTPEEFVEEIMLRKLRVQGVFVGFNYRFGRGATGTPELLIQYGNKYHFTVKVIPPITLHGTLVSSTRIRDLLNSGDIQKARELLGYWPLLRGKIIRGDQRGRTLGFPTANIDLPDDLIVPCSGVYAGQALLEGKRYPAVVNIGYHPTFYNTKDKLIEAHLLGYQGSAYGKKIEIELYQKLREEKKFPVVEELVRQIKKDVQDALRICGRERVSLAFSSKQRI